MTLSKSWKLLLTLKERRETHMCLHAFIGFVDTSYSSLSLILSSKCEDNNILE